MKKPILTLLIIVSIFSCKPEKKERETLFSLLPASLTNVTFTNQLTEDEEFNIIEYLYFNNGAGVAAGDINNDGLTDLYFSASQNANKLYLNKGNLTFEDITESAGVAGSGNWKTGVTMADVNGDGYLDIYVCQVGNYKNFNGRNQLFINQRNNTFKDEAEEYGLAFSGFSTHSAFFDFDMDGDLDMFLLNHSVHTSRSYGNVSLRFEQDSLAGGRLFRNDLTDGRPVFHNISREAGIYSSQIGYGLSVSICDVNNDGMPDIFVSNDFHENDYLYINNGNGTFSEKMTSFFAHTSRSSMGNDVGDINNDGLLDFIVLDMLPDKSKIRQQSGGEDDYDLTEIKLDLGYYHQFVRNTLQLNLGGGKFSEIGRLAGIYSTDWSWSPLLCDADNDGWKDIFITNGIYRRGNDLDYIDFLTGGNRFNSTKDNSKLSDKQLYEKMPLYPNINFIYRNNSDLTFTNMADKWGFNTRSYSNGSTYADLDNDGDLELIVNNINENAYIFRNDADKQLNNHFLSMTFKGNGLNTRGIGARVTIFYNGMIQMAEQFSTRGFMSSASDVIHFGIGSADVIDSLIVRWPDQSVQLLVNIPANSHITLEIKNACKVDHKQVAGKGSSQLFISSSIKGLEFTHKEDKYIDFKRERLMPNSLSAEGPALAVGDINDDGMEDLFVGGAKGQPAEMFVQKKDGSFQKKSVNLFTMYYYTEDVDADFFVADNDGDLDLYIVRGGNELLLGNPMLSDILLINDGTGGFKESLLGSLPFKSHNGSCVSPCDFDRDGDTDLFVGSRSIPGAYGWSPEQMLLENDGNGNFRDLTDAGMDELKNIGMVTDAEWMDYDNDGDSDLILCGEWMNISIFRNDNGVFNDATATSGLDETSGWWNCITISDIDNDGDSDIAGGNLGLNSIIKASKYEPAEMYLNDFDNNGSLDQIICSYEDGKSLPLAPFDEIAAQLTGLKKKYPKYSDFGGKTIREIFGNNSVDQCVVKNAKQLKSCIFLNNGNGTFSTKELPVEAQFAPVRNIIIKDFNSDGSHDLILAGNNYKVIPYLGRQDASYGWYLTGDSANNYKTIMPSRSGLEITGDARKLRLITISGNMHIVAAVNDGNIQIFKVMD